MANGGTILVGTAGQGVFRSPDGGESWSRMSVGNGLHSDAVTRCLTVHPTQHLPGFRCGLADVVEALRPVLDVREGSVDVLRGRLRDRHGTQHRVLERRDVSQ